MLPSDPHKKFLVRRLCEVINSGTQPIQNLPVLVKVEKELGGNREEWAKFYINEGLRQFEEFLGESKGTYCVGDTVSLADAFLIPQLYNAARFKVDMSAFPKIVEVQKNLEALEAFQKADPSQQPDCTE